MVALLWDEGNLEGAIELETMWNDLAATHAFTLFCAYAMSSLETSGDLAAAKRICDGHDRVITVSSSPFIGASAAARTGRDHYDRVFVATPTCVRDVRQFTRDALATWTDTATVDDAEIIASELATNAVKHARSPFRVSLSRADGTITVSVRDTSFSPPEQVPRAGCVVGGRGVQLVAAIARAWGARSESDGKTVWAELSLVRDE
jgi:anti-sigma regulatory factor (Ser/Thr protein kinase)